MLHIRQLTASQQQLMTSGLYIFRCTTHTLLLQYKLEIQLPLCGAAKHTFGCQHMLVCLLNIEAMLLLANSGLQTPARTLD